MAKVFGQSSDLSGKVGNITYMQTKYGTVAYPTRKQVKVPRRSERQMEIRTQWVNLGAIYRQFRQTLQKSFENVGQMSSYNAFLQANLGVVKVYITKQDRLNGGSVLAPYLITRGGLDSIAWSVNEQNVLVTSLALGSLVIDENTTVGQMSHAIINNNEDWKNGDQIAYFIGVQTIDAVTQTPRARIKGCKLVLDVKSSQKLWEVVNKIGFASVSGQGGYYLGMSTAVTNGAAAWVHSRDDGNTLKVSTQYLYVDNAILNSYMDGSAFDSSVNSYGGINTASVFLDPNTSSSGTGNENDNENENPSTGSGEDQNDNDNQNGGTTNGGNTNPEPGTVNPEPGTGGDTGGGGSTESGGGTNSGNTNHEPGTVNPEPGTGGDTGGGGSNTGDGWEEG